METSIKNKSQKIKKLEVRIESNLANDWQELRDYIQRRAQAVSLAKEI